VVVVVVDVDVDVDVDVELRVSLTSSIRSNICKWNLQIKGKYSKTYV
jgi:hypothetical protein